jgi:PAS domain S-box-containing protein
MVTFGRAVDTDADAPVRWMLDAVPRGVIGVTAAGVISWVNSELGRLFGYDRSELLGQPVEILVPERVRDMYAAQWAGYLSHPPTRPMGPGFALVGRHKNGTEIPVEISVTSTDTEAGRFVAAVVRGATDRPDPVATQERARADAERRRFEAELHQSQRLESLGQLAGGIAHDFNNLLGAIVGFAGFVADEAAAAVAEDGAATRWRDVHRDIEQVQRAADQATRLARQLLAFGRRDVTQPRPLTLNTVISGLEALLRRTLGAQIELRTELEPRVRQVLADPGQIEQILVNLAVNARDAMPTGGTLTIETANVERGDDQIAGRPGLQPVDHVRLRITDTGTGIPPEIIDRIFEPFFTTKPKGEGSGLGLATVYGIVIQAQGHLDITSRPGAGTTVTVLLPVTSEPAAARPEPDAPGQRPGHGTILVVEDEEAMLEVTRRILTGNGYQVLTAHDGPEAIALARRHEIALLLTDVILPRAIGVDIAREIHRIRPAACVLFMSGYTGPDIADKGILDAGEAVLEKPFTEPQLLERVTAALGEVAGR